jgi:NAD(P)-dependent dehydrogenase (short-subunit alcohol dehydrogenase family)
MSSNDNSAFRAEAPYDFTGKIALVTGAGRGLGRAAALSLSRCGARVVAVSRTRSDLQSLSDLAPGKIDIWVEDVTDNAFYQRMIDLERLDICLNNAGTNKPMPIDKIDDATLDLMLNLNVRAAFKTAQAATLTMKKHNAGVIINMSSQMGHVGSPRRTVYCLTKHAIEGLTKAMAVELAPYGIRVCSIAPTFVDTPMTKSMFENKEFHDFVYGMIPMKKLATTDDIAAGIVFLASPAASMITGDSLRIDGGWTAQ